ncbi:hypothetical protein DH86_00001355, partial [Scytalidium sp. 3C]
MGDGGKWICGLSQYEKSDKPCIVYSFEQELLTRTNCEIWGYDYSVDDFAPDLEDSFRDRTKFTKAGISGKSNPHHEPPMFAILDLMSMNGHDYIDILKIDIEFAEFEALKAMNEALSPGREFPIGQILIELHLSKPSGLTATNFLAWWEALEMRGFRPTCSELNLVVVTHKAEDAMPRCS